MKVRLFSKGHLPATHSPLCHKSITYVDGLVLTGEAIYLTDDKRDAQLTGWLDKSPDRRDMSSSLTDWFTSDKSYLGAGQFLVITTKQLATR